MTGLACLGRVDKRDSHRALTMIHVWMPPLVQGFLNSLSM
jgi:hypothetical protein